MRESSSNRHLREIPGGTKRNMANVLLLSFAFGLNFFGMRAINQ